ncbi:hypothetical protein B0H13DRAFT_2670918 [Mycena leptocephala]|nr:hypothetical protein B0H13DRAFT_2670918 [Mycena leptocephala]
MSTLGGCQSWRLHLVMRLFLSGLTINRHLFCAACIQTTKPLIELDLIGTIITTSHPSLATFSTRLTLRSPLDLRRHQSRCRWSVGNAPPHPAVWERCRNNA